MSPRHYQLKCYPDYVDYPAPTRLKVHPELILSTSEDDELTGDVRHLNSLWAVRRYHPQVHASAGRRHEDLVRTRVVCVVQTAGGDTGRPWKKSTS